MNKKHAVLGAALVLALTGCKDATAKLKDTDTVIVTVGKSNITKGDIFNSLLSNVGATNTITNANNEIAAAEIEVTDEMKQSAQKTLDTYVTMYGDVFTEYLASNGMSEEKYINEYLIPSLQAEKLVTKYLEENYDSICETYTPVKAIILEFSSSEDGQSALSALKDGSMTAEEAAKNFNSLTTAEEKIITNDSTSVDSLVRTVLFGGSKDDGWTYIPSSDETVFNVVKIVENDPSVFKDEVFETLSSFSTIQNDSTKYYFEKYGFHVYDIRLYNILKADYPENLVQDGSAQ